jgi:hypothetical protein
MLSHTQVVDLRCRSTRDPYRIQEVPLLQRFSQSPRYDPIPRWVGVHGLCHKYVGLFMISYGSNMNHAVASVANIFVGLFAPVRLCAPRSAEHADTHPSDVVHCRYGGVSKLSLLCRFLPLIVLRPQLVIHGVLASRILFNLRQSRETDSEIIDRIFPLAHAPQTSFRCNDDLRLHPHDQGRVKDPCNW